MKLFVRSLRPHGSFGRILSGLRNGDAPPRHYRRSPESWHQIRSLHAGPIFFTRMETHATDGRCHAFDALVYCKSYERRSYEALGKPLVYMPLGYCDEFHRPLPSSDPRWCCTVGFLGGWEPRREQLLLADRRQRCRRQVLGRILGFCARWQMDAAQKRYIKAACG